MNKLAHFLSLWVGIWTLITGIPGQDFLPASWTVIFNWLPDYIDWIWPGLFISTGIISIVGFFSVRCIVLGLSLNSLAYLIWGSTSLWALYTDQGGTIPGSSAYYNNAGLTIMLAYFVHKNRVIDEKVAEIGQKAVSILEGQSDLVTR